MCVDRVWSRSWSFKTSTRVRVRVRLNYATVEIEKWRGGEAGHLTICAFQFDLFN